MRALRMIQKVDQNGQLHIQVPPGMGTLFELVVLPVDPERDAELLSSFAVQSGDRDVDWESFFGLEASGTDKSENQGL